MTPKKLSLKKLWQQASEVAAKQHVLRSQGNSEDIFVIQKMMKKDQSKRKPEGKALEGCVGMRRNLFRSLLIFIYLIEYI